MKCNGATRRSSTMVTTSQPPARINHRNHSGQLIRPPCVASESVPRRITQIFVSEAEDARAALRRGARNPTSRHCAGIPAENETLEFVCRPEECRPEAEPARPAQTPSFICPPLLFPYLNRSARNNRFPVKAARGQIARNPPRKVTLVSYAARRAAMEFFGSAERLSR